MSNAVSVYSMSFGSDRTIFVIVLFLESLTVKSSYYKKIPFCRLYLKFCDSYQPDICFIRCVCGYCRLDQCNYQKKSENDRIIICGFHTPGNLKKSFSSKI